MSVSLENLVEKTPYSDLLRAIGEQASDLDIETYAVGGFVRDTLLGRPTTDIDLVCVGPGTGLILAEAVRKSLGGHAVHIYENFGTAAIRVEHAASGKTLVLEFVGTRKESYSRDSRKPAVESGTMAEDQARRDFTVNALAIDVHPDRFGVLLDSFGGVSDLNEGILRTPLEPEATFDDDPLRIVRAARFAAQLNFEVAPETLAGMKSRAGRMDIVSPERIGDELMKIICSSKPSIGFRLLYECGVLERILPDLVALQGVETVDGVKHKDNFFHTLKVVDNLVESLEERDRPTIGSDANPLSTGGDCLGSRGLRWAALFHDIGKTSTKRFTDGLGWSFHGHEERGARMIPGIFRSLRLPTDERMKFVQHMIRLHHRPVSLVDDIVTDSAVRRLLFEAGDSIEDLMLLVRADITSKNPRRVKKYLTAFDSVESKFEEVEEKDRLRNFQPPVDGAEIMSALCLPPSRAVGVIKTAIREAILDGLLANEHDAAFEYMMSVKDELLAGLDESYFRAS